MPRSGCPDPDRAPAVPSAKLRRRFACCLRPRRAGRTRARVLTACGKTQAAFDRRSIPAEPLRFAAFCVAFRSKYTRYSSLTRLVSRAPHRSRRSPGFHHRLLTDLGQPLSAAASARETVDAEFPHQPGNALSADPPALALQLAVDSGSAVGAVVTGMHTADFLLEHLVRPGSAAQRPGLPGVVAAPRDAENPRHRGDSMLGLVSVDEPIDHVVIDAADGAAGTRKERGRPAPDRAVSLAGHFVRLRPRTPPGRIVRAALAGAVLVFHRSQRAESARPPKGARKAFRLPVPPPSRRSRIRRGSVRRHFCSLFQGTVPAQDSNELPSPKHPSGTSVAARIPE